MHHKTVSRRRLTVLLLLTVVVLGGLLALADWEEVTNAVAEADWRPLLPAFAMVTISYLCISYSFAVVSKLLGIDMGHHHLAGIGFVSSVLNHLVQSGGVAGYSVRYALMRSDTVSLDDVLASSILHFYLTSLMMQAMLPFGFAYLYWNASLSRTGAVAIAIVTIVVLCIFAVATALVFAPRIRQPVLRFAARVAGRITKKDVRPILRDFDAAMTRGTVALRARPAVLGMIVALVIADWIASAFALGFCFEALGSPLIPGVLFTGFVIGIMAGVLSSLPAGIGVQEGSMAGVFGLLGVPFGQAVLASILFRVVFYLVPYVISLGFYVRLVPQTTRQRL